MGKNLGLGLAIGLGMMMGLHTSANAQDAQRRTLSGTVSYLPKLALPEGAVVTVTLEDISRADAVSREIGKTTFPTEGRQVPLPWEISYEVANLRPQDRYAVRAMIHIGGNLAWTTDSVYSVKLDGTDPALELMTIQVPQTRPDVPDDITQLHGYKWVLYELDGAEVEQAAWTPHVNFNADQMQVGGRGGVNVIGGSYTRDGVKLTFGPIRSTMMAGPEKQMRTEQRFVAIFPRVTTAKLFRDKLVWYAKGVPVAKFTAFAAE